MLAIWNFAHVLTAAVHITWWGLNVQMEKFAKWWRQTLEIYWGSFATSYQGCSCEYLQFICKWLQIREIADCIGQKKSKQNLYFTTGKNIFPFTTITAFSIIYYIFYKLLCKHNLKQEGGSIFDKHILRKWVFL